MVQAPSVYVCGFVERPDAPPKDACLHLDPLTVKSQLPLKKPLPLTVEHLPDAPVGSVFGLYQSRAGLFSAASITSGDFLSLLDSIYHDCDIAQSQRLPLPREPKVEALHAWLPSLSLASLHPDIPQTTADGGKLSFFDHVSICAHRTNRVLARKVPDEYWYLLYRALARVGFPAEALRPGNRSRSLCLFLHDRPDVTGAVCACVWAQLGLRRAPDLSQMQRRKPAVASAVMPGAYPVQTLFRHGELFRFIWAHYVRPTVAADPQASISSLFPGLVLLALELKLMDGQAPSHYAINLTGQKFDTLFEIINQKLLFHDPAAMLAARTQLRLAFEDGVGVALGRPSPTLAAREILERQFSASDDYDRLYFLTLGYLASPVAPS